MEKAKVYFTDMHAKTGNSLLDKLDRLCRQAGIEQIDFKDKLVAIKIHFGEPGNLAYLRANYARVVCDLVKELGGKPFLTDCNTLYVGGRTNAVDHLNAAYKNGFNPLALGEGVQCIIADGLKGRDERLVPVEGGELVQFARIGSALADADIVISLTHFKGHVSTGFGGCLKNLGMGGGSRAGKLAMHNEGTPDVHEDLCIGCGLCVKNCANNGIKVVDGKAQIQSDCVGCGYCMTVCPRDAINTNFSHSSEPLCKKIAEYTKAVVDGKPAFHISLVMDISPFCDCEGYNDVPITPDVGMFASFDPVALDQACYEAVLRQPVFEGSRLAKAAEKNHCDCCGDGSIDYFKLMRPNSEADAGLTHAEKLGLGTREYELVTL